MLAGDLKKNDMFIRWSGSSTFDVFIVEREQFLSEMGNFKVVLRRIRLTSSDGMVLGDITKDFRSESLDKYSIVHYYITDDVIKDYILPGLFK